VPTRREPDRATVADSSVGAEGLAGAETLAAHGPAARSANTDDEPATRLPPGTVIDHFVVLEQLGAGGMGVVVAARDRLLDRKVAIKVLRRLSGDGADRASVRLLREAQAMARLQHPNVVTVFEAGTHEGQIFLAMELIDGPTLGQWLREQPRSTRDILEVFVRAGRGLAASHRLGMVHRDFKPENVLVARDGQVRVTDFGLVGLASASDDEPAPARSADRTSLLDQPLTRTGAVLGTPRYMAPEQHRNAPVTAGADQFAFCVALHEALYGVPPFRGATVRELRDSVLAGQPVAPPADSERRDVPSWLRGIVLRGLAVAPEDRWPGMAALIDALSHDPSVARRRRWRSAAGGVAIAGAVALGVLARRTDGPPPCPSPDDRLTGVWDAPVRTAVSSAFAATGRTYAADTFTRAAGTLDGYARAWVAMRTEACEATAVRHEQSPALLDRRMQCLDRRLIELGALTALFRGAPDPVVVDRAVPATLALAPLATCADAEGLLAQVPLPVDPAGRVEVAALRTELARSTALTRAGKPRDALAAVTPLVARARTLGHALVLAEVLQQLGAAQRDADDPKVAEATLIEAAQAGAAAKEDTLVARALIEQMWVVGYRGGRRGEALALVPYIEAAVTRAGDDPLVRGGVYRYQAILLNAEGKFADAQAAVQRALTLYARANPEGREVALALVTMGNICNDRNDLVPARAAYEHAHRIMARLYGPDHPDVIAAQNNVANVLFKEGDLAAALEIFRAVLAVNDRVSGPTSQRTGMTLNNLGMVLDAQEQWEEAHSINLRALAIYEHNLGPDHPDLVEPLSNLGDEMLAQARWAEAEAYYARALAIREHALGKDSVRTAYALALMTRLRLAERRFAEALPMARRVLEVCEHGLPPGNQQIGEALILIARAAAGLSRVEDGLAAAERAIAVLAAIPDEAPVELGDAWLEVARVARQAGRQVRAQEAAGHARKAYERVEPEVKRTRKLHDLAAWAAGRP
jgi:tetratricopeptide (TPR) repeat protein